MAGTRNSALKGNIENSSGKSNIAGDDATGISTGKRNTKGATFDPADATAGTPGTAGAADGGSGGSSAVIDPASIGDDEYQRDSDGNLVIGKSGKPNRKRGRKGGTLKREYAKTVKGNSQTLKQGIDTLSQTLVIVHMGLASFTKFDEFNIDSKESDALASSIANVMAQFNWSPDPRFTAVVGLVTVSTQIYGPRIYLYREHLKEKAKDKPKKDEKSMALNVNDLTYSTLAGAGNPAGFGIVN